MTTNYLKLAAELAFARAIHAKVEPTPKIDPVEWTVNTLHREIADLTFAADEAAKAHDVETLQRICRETDVLIAALQTTAALAVRELVRRRLAESHLED